MIKRTGEHVLTWIGVGLTALGVLLIGLILPFMQSDAVISSMVEQDGSITYEDAANSTSFLQVFFGGLLVIGIITLVLAIIGGVFINKKAKTAGILLIIAGAISLLGNWLVAILWIVAGIMLLVRKPKDESLTQDGYYNYDKANEVAKERDVHDVEHQDPVERELNERKKDDDPYKY